MLGGQRGASPEVACSFSGYKWNNSLEESVQKKIILEAGTTPRETVSIGRKMAKNEVTTDIPA